MSFNIPMIEFQVVQLTDNSGQPTIEIILLKIRIVYFIYQKWKSQWHSDQIDLDQSKVVGDLSSLLKNMSKSRRVDNAQVPLMLSYSSLFSTPASPASVSPLCITVTFIIKVARSKCITDNRVLVIYINIICLKSNI